MTVRIIGGREARGTGENHQHVTSRLLVTWQLSRVAQELLTLPEHFNLVIGDKQRSTKHTHNVCF